MGIETMSSYAIKIQQLIKEISKYINYDWDAFDSLTIDEKIAEHSKISNILLRRKMSRHFYLKHLGMFSNENRDKRTEHRIKNKIIKLATLIDILNAIINQMEMKIILLE